MWIPYNLMPPLKADLPPETIAASAASKEPRGFVVGFYVRGSGQKAWEADILVASLAPQTEVLSTGPATILFSGATTGKLTEIVYTLQATGAMEALKAAYEGAARLVEELCLRHGRALDMIGWRVADSVHFARWRCVPFLPSALMGTAERYDIPAHLEPVVRLYREARSAARPLWRLLCAAAVLDQIFDRSDESAATNAESPVTLDMLVRSGAYGVLPELQNVPISDLRKRIEPVRQHHMRLLGSARPSQQAEPVSADLPPPASRYDDDIMLSALANLADLVARDVLLAQLTHWAAANRPNAAEVADAGSDSGLETAGVA